MSIQLSDPDHSDHDNHLCFLAMRRQMPTLAKDGQFVRLARGRAANKAENPRSPTPPDEVQ